ncbi:MAG: DUF1684 domain-containing protein [Cytophagaceae bacterium]|nr:DUF1684 domain-containing protein [Cytophagaceae bacterium]MDW8455478.1 DUF1684 domain-containing protein [Cytophagaceae bacterium]
MMKVFDKNVNYTTVIIFSGALLSVLIFLRLLLTDKPGKYEQLILTLRKEKEAELRTMQPSPLENMPRSKTFDYYRPDERYKVKAALFILRDSTDFLNIINNDGQQEKYLRYALAVFSLNGKTDSLTLLKNDKLMGTNLCFVPFFDKTNGHTTYEGGRYLNIEISDQKFVWIDFNLAYNPYCVYDYRYTCPLPPRENSLDMPIKAGEKKLKNY